MRHILNLIRTEKPCGQLRRYLVTIGQPYYFIIVAKDGDPGGEMEITGDLITIPGDETWLKTLATAGLLKAYDYTLESTEDTCIDFIALHARLNVKSRTACKCTDPPEILTGPFVLRPTGADVAPVTTMALQPSPTCQPGRIFYNALNAGEKATVLNYFLASYDRMIVNHYINFVGRGETARLATGFRVADFVGTWYQVATSVSTLVLGTGIGKRSVQARYTVIPGGAITVENSGITPDGAKIEITGISLARTPVIPTCRTVQFGSFPIGNYWIIYQSRTVILVCAPLIVLGALKDPRFGIYVLARDRAAFARNTREQIKLRGIYRKYGFTQPNNTPIPTGV